jgi:DNA-directed RNA polymerase specialized sigma24 family protein
VTQGFLTSFRSFRARRAAVRDISCGMNKLPPRKRVQILSMLMEGSSMQSIARVADVSFNAVKKLLKDAG